MQLYPLFAHLAGRAVLVVGGGKVAERKVSALLAAGAQVSVGAPHLTPGLSAWAAAGKLHHRAGSFIPSWLEAQWLVIAATDDRETNRHVAESAGTRRIWVNVVDDAVLSTFHVPAVVDRHPLMVAISTGGAAPALAGLVRARIEAVLDGSLGALVELSQRFRGRIKRRLPDAAARRRFYAWLLHGPVARLLRAGDVAASERTLLAGLEAKQPRAEGSVAIVGAGPGSADLLTLGALRRLQEADVVLHDRLVGADVLALARRDAELIDVGKAPRGRHTQQEVIHALMETHARRGLRVVRLKGGDPFIFGRGGEELQFLRSKRIPYEVIPGVTAASACAAYAGVPLTHRALAHSLHLITAYDDASVGALHWPALAREKQTLAVYMGVAQLGVLSSRLIQHGRSASTPAVFIENGSLPQQRIITGTLGEVETLARAHCIVPPTLLIVGEVAALAHELGWFGREPASTLTWAA